MKECKKCKTLKPLEDYHINKAARDNRATWCKSCCVEETRRKRQDPLEKEKWATYAWRSTLKRRYGITEKEWLELYEQQKGCAICGLNKSGGRGEESRLAVDHDHKTGKVRGLLCSSCNRGLGLFKDNQKLLKQAISYLDKNN